MGRIEQLCRGAVILSFVISASGCKSPPVAGAAPLNVVEGTAAGTDTSYRLQVGDGLAVHFFAFPDLDETATVGPDGHVSLRLIDDFPIAGMTLAEATKETNERYQKVLRRPNVSLEIKSYALQQVYVAGQVNNPGVIRSSIPLTASGAIAQAGGIKLPNAHTQGALLLRRKPDGTVVYYRLAFNGDLPGGAVDPVLRTNDLIYIPRSPITVIADFIQANITRIIPISASYSIYHSY